MSDCVYENGNAIGRFISNSTGTFSGVIDFADNPSLSGKVIKGPSNNTVVPTAFVDPVSITTTSASVRVFGDGFGTANNNTFGWQLVLTRENIVNVFSVGTTNTVSYIFQQLPTPFLANNGNGLALEWCKDNVATAVNSSSTINVNNTATDLYSGTCRIKIYVDPSVAGNKGNTTLNLFAILSVFDNYYNLAYTIDANPTTTTNFPPSPTSSTSYINIPFNVSWFNVTETTTFEGIIYLNVSITANPITKGNAGTGSLTLTTTSAKLIDKEAEDGLTVASYIENNITKAIFYVNTDPISSDNKGNTSGFFSAKYKLTYGYLSDLISNMPKLGICNEVDTAFNSYLSNLKDMFKNNSTNVVTYNALLVSDTVPTQIISLSECIKNACCSNNKVISSIVKVINSILEDYDNESIGYKLSVLSKLNKLKSLTCCVYK
jgi:hypothetical protein